MPGRLVEWDSFDIRINGGKVQTIARTVLKSQNTPLESIALEFADGVLRVSGTARKKIAIPFQFVVRQIVVRGNAVVVPLEEMSAFGFLPLPALLTRMVGSRKAAEGIFFDADRNAVVIQLDRFLPPFLDVEVADIRIIKGGLAVRLGPGGADLPESGGGKPWSGLTT